MKNNELKKYNKKPKPELQLLLKMESSATRHKRGYGGLMAASECFTRGSALICDVTRSGCQREGTTMSF